MGKRKGESKEKKKKGVTVSLLKRVHSGNVTTPYRMVDALVNELFPELRDARFGWAWNMAPPREDGDGQVTFYRVKKASDLDREFSPYDFVLIVNHDIWNKRLNDDEMIACAHEMLCHCGVVRDKNGEIKVDERDRPIFRVRKADVKTFRDNVAKYGQWRPEVHKLVESATEFKDSQRPLLKDLEPEKKPKGQGFSEPAMGSGAATNGHAREGMAGKPKGKRGKAAKK